MTEMTGYELDIRRRLRNDMTASLNEHGIAATETLLDALVEDALHQIEKAWEERTT